MIDPDSYTDSLYIAGEWSGAASGGTLVVDNPETGEVVAKFAEGGRADVRRAIDAAESALAAWSGC